MGSLLRKHEGRFSCSFRNCESKFTRKANLNDHLTSHGTEDLNCSNALAVIDRSAGKVIVMDIIDCSTGRNQNLFAANYQNTTIADAADRSRDAMLCWSIGVIATAGVLEARGIKPC